MGKLERNLSCIPASAKQMTGNQQTSSMNKLDGGAILVTLSLLAAIVSMFFVEAAMTPGSGISSTPDIGTLVRLGGLNRQLVFRDHEWWRLFTATFLHANAMHIIFNSIALLFGGLALERAIGSARFAAIYAASALFGSLASILIHEGSTVSVGASGAIMGVLAAALVLSFRYRAGSGERKTLQEYQVRVLIPSLVPAASGGVDIAAHFGGAICGAALGGVLYLTRSRDSSLTEKA
jgi:rhomboid protease GluP